MCMCLWGVYAIEALIEIYTLAESAQGARFLDAYVCVRVCPCLCVCM